MLSSQKDDNTDDDRDASADAVPEQAGLGRLLVLEQMATFPIPHLFWKKEMDEAQDKYDGCPQKSPDAFLGK